MNPLHLLAYAALAYLLVEIVRAALNHYSRGNEYHQYPLPLHHALLVGAIEVCVDRPRAFHRSRMEVVHRAEQRRLDDIEDAKLRHPANWSAREQCKANHPSAVARATELVSAPA